LDRGAFKLRPSLILSLQREALAGISMFAGNYRPAGVAIEDSKHEPVGAHLVPELIEEMCDYLNERSEQSTPIHLAAYLMWRLNWIHPFADGKGRLRVSCRMSFYRSGPGPCCPARQPFRIRSSTIAIPTSMRWMRLTPPGRLVLLTYQGWRNCSAPCWRDNWPDSTGCWQEVAGWLATQPRGPVRRACCGARHAAPRNRRNAGAEAR
jgi:hypothetical protein